MKKILLITAFAAGVVSCTVVKPHQVAVKSKLGKIDNKVRMPGPVAYNPFVTKVVKVNVRTMNLSIKENLPSKENTLVGEFGIRISGGQRQRIAIAKAVYQNKKILILDEGTNALDEEIEKKIIQDIFKLKTDSVIILVTHNLKAAKMCDVIYKLSDGELKEIKF